MKRFRTQSLFALLILVSSTHADEPKPLSCYLPNLQQVAYSEVTALESPSPDAVLAYGSDPLQFGELWLPPQRDEKRRLPMVIFVHGGCWLNQYDIKHTHALSAALSQSGYAVWSIEYRRTGDKGGGWPGSFNDIKAAIQFAKSLNRYSLDRDRIVIAGHSAGGHLALLAASELQSNISTVIGLAAIVDLEQYSLGSNSCQTATPNFMSGTAIEKPRAYDAANPARQTLHPSTVLIHGDHDNIVPVDQALSSTARSNIVGGAGHFDMIHPATAAYQQLLKELALAFR